MNLIPVTEDPLNAGTPLSALREELTAPDLVYVRNHFKVPDFTESEYSLLVEGVNGKTKAFNLPDLQALGQTTLRVVLECAGNGRKAMDPLPSGTPWDYGAVSIVEFTGTPLNQVLNHVGLDDDVIEILFQGADGGEVAPGRRESFARSLPLEMAMRNDTLLAWGLNGMILPKEHGWPLRLVVPGWYGMASVKWLTKVTAITQPYEGYFQSEHYVYSDENSTPEGQPVTNIRPRSLMINLEPGAVVQQDEGVVIQGVAWSGYGPITQVEISADGGKRWHRVSLDTQASNYGVQRWQYFWKPTKAGKVTLICRAGDSRGNIQPDYQRWNRLGYGNNGPHSVEVVVSQ